ncbi:MAG: MoxR family ATPase [Myxococcota bacterium]|nr:MoxR family ATPase [Myxococcota bacterium]
MTTKNETIEARVARFGDDVRKVRETVGRRIVGQQAILDGVITCLVAGGNALLEGVPGLGKTMLVRSLADAMHLRFARIQFTPDLMPADILGTTVIIDRAADQGRGGSKQFEFRPGPVFANIVLADEVNRATPKTQSALLEVMQEHRVTIGNETHRLEEPYLVLATQNPLEMEGTYPLPEAQLDRFFFKLHVGFPSREELHAILDRTTGEHEPDVEPVLDGPRILEMRALAREVPVPRHVQDYAIRVLEATHPDRPDASDRVKQFVRFGASPRGAQACLLAAKIHALTEGRFAATIEDVRAVAIPALRHRVILGFEGEAEGVRTEALLEEVLARVPETVSR